MIAEPSWQRVEAGKRRWGDCKEKMRNVDNKVLIDQWDQDQTNTQSQVG